MKRKKLSQEPNKSKDKVMNPKDKRRKVNSSPTEKVTSTADPSTSRSNQNISQPTLRLKRLDMKCLEMMKSSRKTTDVPLDLAASQVALIKTPKAKTMSISSSISRSNWKFFQIWSPHSTKVYEKISEIGERAWNQWYFSCDLEYQIKNIWTEIFDNDDDCLLQVPTDDKDRKFIVLKVKKKWELANYPEVPPPEFCNMGLVGQIRPFEDDDDEDSEQVYFHLVGTMAELFDKLVKKDDLLCIWGAKRLTRKLVIRGIKNYELDCDNSGENIQIVLFRPQTVLDIQKIREDLHQPLSQIQMHRRLDLRWVDSISKGMFLLITPADSNLSLCPTNSNGELTSRVLAIKNSADAGDGERPSTSSAVATNQNNQSKSIPSRTSTSSKHDDSGTENPDNVQSEEESDDGVQNETGSDLNLIKEKGPAIASLVSLVLVESDNESQEMDVENVQPEVDSDRVQDETGSDLNLIKEKGPAIASLVSQVLVESDNESQEMDVENVQPEVDSDRVQDETVNKLIKEEIGQAQVISQVMEESEAISRRLMSQVFSHTNSGFGELLSASAENPENVQLEVESDEMVQKDTGSELIKLKARQTEELLKEQLQRETLVLAAIRNTQNTLEVPIASTSTSNALVLIQENAEISDSGSSVQITNRTRRQAVSKKVQVDKILLNLNGDVNLTCCASPLVPPPSAQSITRRRLFSRTNAAPSTRVKIEAIDLDLGRATIPITSEDRNVEDSEEILETGTQPIPTRNPEVNGNETWIVKDEESSEISTRPRIKSRVRIISSSSSIEQLDQNESSETLERETMKSRERVRSSSSVSIEQVDRNESSETLERGTRPLNSRMCKINSDSSDQEEESSSTSEKVLPLVKRLRKRNASSPDKNENEAGVIKSRLRNTPQVYDADNESQSSQEDRKKRLRKRKKSSTQKNENGTKTVKSRVRSRNSVSGDESEENETKRLRRGNADEDEEEAGSSKGVQKKTTHRYSALEKALRKKFNIDMEVQTVLERIKWFY